MIHRIFFILPLVMTLAMFRPLQAQHASLSPEQLTNRFDRVLSDAFQPDGPGCAAIVAVKGKVIYHKAFGKADLELNVDMRPEMVFRIGSITKQFTAVAILQLEESGKLSLKDPITKYLPDYPVHGYTITIEHLLTHTSGIHSYTSMKEWTSEIRKKDFSIDSLIRFFKDQPMDFEPGTKWSYSNSGYILLGKIIEVASGMTYPQYLREKIFLPLELNHSSYDSTHLVIRDRIKGYAKGDQGFENAEYLSMTQPYAAGSLISTVEDLYKWTLGIRSGKIIKRENLEKAFIPCKTSDGKPTNYGYGWMMGEIDGSKVILHGGGINGFLTLGLWIPDEEVFVAVFSNCENQSPDNATLKMAAMTIGKFPEYTTITLDSISLSSYTGIYEDGGGLQRKITYSDGKLWSQRTGGGLFELKAVGQHKFIFSDDMASYEFQADNSGKVKSLIFRRLGSETSEWKRTDKMVQARPEMKLDAAILQQYAGVYELVPGFTLTMTVEEGKLMTQASGQPKFELFAEKGNLFFLKVVDASVEFIRGEDGKVNALILHQNGDHKAKRIN